MTQASGPGRSRPAPEWFTICDAETPNVMRRIAAAVSKDKFCTQVNMAPRLAHWFLLDAMLLANRANRDGMHANALALTRQCIEAMGVVELGVCGHAQAEAVLVKWEADQLTAGNLRAWLEREVWPSYGSGLWSEPWGAFMRQFAAALQPYAHYGRSVAQWQTRLHFMRSEPGGGGTGVMEFSPRAYDPQKATRITLFHAILTYALGRIWCAANEDDAFAASMARFAQALGKSRYLDGHETEWGQQFWAFVWDRSGESELE